MNRFAQKYSFDKNDTFADEKFDFIVTYHWNKKCEQELKMIDERLYHCEGQEEN